MLVHLDNFGAVILGVLVGVGILLVACDGSTPNLHNIKCRERAENVHVHINYLPLEDVKKQCNGYVGCSYKYTGQIYVPTDYYRDHILAHELNHMSCKVEVP